ncbi:MAG: hypothetical protein OCC45_08315 [Desulfotalea sp.]
MAEKTKPPIKKSAKIYVGPTLRQPIFVKNATIFKGGELPAYLGDLAKDKNFKVLCVPIADLGKAKSDLTKKDTEIAKAYIVIAKGGA